MIQNYNLGGSEEEAIQQRIKMAEMLRAQGMTPLDANTTRRIHPLEGLAKILQSYMGARDLAGANAEKTALMQQRKDAMGAENEKLAGLLMGTPAMPMPTRLDDEGNSNAGLDIAAKAPDRQGAIAALMQSQDPSRQGMGLQMMLAQPKSALDYMGKLDPKDYTPESFAKFQQTLNPSMLAPRVKNEFVNGQAVNPYETKAGTVIPQQLAPDSVVTRDAAGRLVPNDPVVQAKGQIAAASRPVTNVNLPPAEKAFQVETAKLDAKQLDEFRDNAMKAQSGLSRIGEMKRLNQEGVYSGTLAEGRTGVANFFNTLGVKFDDKKLGNSQEYIKHAKELTLSLLKEGVGASQISNADLKFVNDTVPLLESSAEARTNLLNYIEGRLASSVDRFQRADQYARKNGGLSGFDYAAKPQASGKVRKYNPATGMIE